GGNGERPGREKPERLALEPWLYRLALDALDELSRPEGTNGGAIRLEESAREPNVKASDEPELQFHQPDEAITEETTIADGPVSSPERVLHSISAARDHLRKSPRLFQQFKGRFAITGTA